MLGFPRWSSGVLAEFWGPSLGSGVPKSGRPRAHERVTGHREGGPDPAKTRYKSIHSRTKLGAAATVSRSEATDYYASSRVQMSSIKSHRAKLAESFKIVFDIYINFQL